MSVDETGRQVERLREELLQAIDRLGPALDVPDSGRVRTSEVVRGLLAAVTKTGGEHSTVKIGRNASGQATFEVSVRTGDSEAIGNAAEASAEALRLYRELDELLPYLGKGSGA